MAALADLDIREQPGEPGTDPSRSGGITPLFLLERTPTSMTWKVMSGDKVATSMTAHFQPIDDGARTRVTAQVKRGNAPDDLVPPAFRSEATTLGLFSMSLESELDELTVSAGDPDKCRELIQRFAMAGHPDGPNSDALRQDNLGDAVGDVASATIRIAAMEAEMKRNGCNTNRPAGGMRPVTTSMSESSSRPVEGLSFQPGKPMVDLSKR
jgi:hypothetical protein